MTDILSSFLGRTAQAASGRAADPPASPRRRVQPRPYTPPPPLSRLLTAPQRSEPIEDTKERRQADDLQARSTRGTAALMRSAGESVRDQRPAVRPPVIPGDPDPQMAPLFPTLNSPMAPMTSDEAPTAMAARATGAPAEFLSHLIDRESGGDPNAAAGTSSARGHGQFIDNTWYAMVQRYGARYGAGELASQITRTSRGKYQVASADAQRQIMAMREDPRWAALMTGHYSQENAAALRARLGRDVREGEVYLAHFLGDQTAAALIREASRSTTGRGRSVTQIVGADAVNANRNVFFDRSGRARTAREVIERQTAGFRRNVFPASTRTP